jgi:hypothetical protein
VRAWAIAALQTAWLVPLTDPATVATLTADARLAAAQIVSVNGYPVPCGRHADGEFVGFALPTEIAIEVLPAFEASIPLLQSQNPEELQVEAAVMLSFQESLQEQPTAEQVAAARAAMAAGMTWTQAYDQYMGGNAMVDFQASGGSQDPLGGGGCGTGCNN